MIHWHAVNLSAPRAELAKEQPGGRQSTCRFRVKLLPAGLILLGHKASTLPSRFELQSLSAAARAVFRTPVLFSVAVSRTRSPERLRMAHPRCVLSVGAVPAGSPVDALLLVVAGSCLSCVVPCHYCAHYPAGRWSGSVHCPSARRFAPYSHSGSDSDSILFLEGSFISSHSNYYLSWESSNAEKARIGPKAAARPVSDSIHTRSARRFTPAGGLPTRRGGAIT